MSERKELARGSCPGAYTPMESGDGLIIRVRAGARSLAAQELYGLSSIAEDEGNGMLELTRRANVQLRGLRPSSVARAQARLVALGLAHERPELEARLALLVSPRLADGAGQALAHMLLTAPLAGPLSAKFGLVLDDAACTLADVDADFRVELSGDERVLISAGGTRARALLLGQCALSEAAAVIAQLLHVLTSAGDSPQRARALMFTTPAQLAPAALPVRGPAPSLLGPEGSSVGLGVPFGSGHAQDFRRLAGLAQRFGSGRLRITHQRVVRVLDVPASAVPALQAEAAGFVLHDDDARSRLIACPGAPACASAHGETRALALSLASQLPAHATLHVSGCAKGCAHGGTADFTLVHDADGTKLGLACDVTRAAQAAPLRSGELGSRLRTFKQETL